ncbi:hypothetical protein [Lysobacter antibioticus]|uniref:hypothetical protein n=1 Tax=Lysobacter antibioticus TaxID=84531 RepID=UPI00126A3E28|nr:hypothetical protein [Lysobacter antibioticus]
MLSFSWLHELGDDRWQPARDGGWYIVIPLTAFLDSSGARQSDIWDEAFDAWGRQQSRKYSLGPIVGFESQGDLCVVILAAMGGLPRPELPEREAQYRDRDAVISS